MRQRLIIIAIVIGVVGLLQPALAFADPGDTSLTPDQLAIIKRSCVTAQGQLERVQLTDKVVRTNRGESYNSLLKLMNTLNSRLSANNFDASNLVPITSSLQAKLQQFIDDFTKYDNSIASTIEMDCQSQPAAFYSSLTQTRGLRQQLAGDTKDMDGQVDGYQAAVSLFRASIVKPSSGTSAQ